MMSRTLIAACFLLMALRATGGAVQKVSALDIKLPAETAVYKPSDLPGYPLVLRNCLICHSAQYVQYQPKSTPAYWERTVTKMKKTFGAIFPDEDIPLMVDYLVKTYSNSDTQRHADDKHIYP